MVDNESINFYNVSHDGESPARSPEKGEGDGVPALGGCWNRPGSALQVFPWETEYFLEMLERIAAYLGYDLVLVKRRRSRKGGK